jgi:hypothetical protein
MRDPLVEPRPNVDSNIDMTDSRICEVEGGKFIAFWHGQVVCRLDGALRYFPTEQDARLFLDRRDRIGSAMLGVSPTRRGVRKLSVGAPGRGA